MTIDETKNRTKQNLESGALEANLRALDFPDEHVEGILNICKRAIEGYYGDEIFSPEHNQYLKLLEQ